MSRFLHRPMFRRGGSTGEGITSGLTRPGYKRGRVVEPGGYKGDIDFWDLMEKYPEARKKRIETLGEFPKGTSGADFWLNFGTNILAQPGGRPILQTLGTAAKEPLSQYQQQKTMDRLGQREEEKDFLNTYLTTQAELRGGEAGATFKHGDMAAGAVELQNQINAHNDSWNIEWDNISKDDLKKDPDYIEWDRKKRNLNLKMNNYAAITGVDLEFVLSKLGDDGVTNLQDEIVDEIGKDESLMIKNGQPVMDPDEPAAQLTVSEYYTQGGPGEAELQWEVLRRLGLKLNELERQNKIEKQNIERGWTHGTHAEGGRAGYQGGELVEQEDVNIQTPRGDVAMQETIEEGTTPDQLSFQELRSRLPVEITDDIIRLMVNSPEALTDFAQIQTQQDVDNFNAKYGVNLVLASEA